MNVTKLVLNLKSKITNDPLEQAMVSKAIRLLELGAVKEAGSFSALPTASSSNVGEIYFIPFEGLYYSTGEQWIPIAQTSVNSAWGWGHNGRGQLGDNTGTYRSSPVSVIGGFTDWIQVSVSKQQCWSLGLRRNGTVWGWGGTFYGTLGNNTNCFSMASPVSVVGGFTDWCRISAGGIAAFALRTNGTLWSWGGNSSGELGDNTTISRSSPVSVVGGFTDWSKISSGALGDAIGIRTNGQAWAWGRNIWGQLGDNSATSRSSPVSVVGGFTDWSQISVGSYGAIGLRTNGTIWGWGRNFYGEAGDGTSISRSSPVSVVGGFTDWCQVSAGCFHSMGLRTNGTLWAWGSGSQGKLGNNCTSNFNSPISVVGGFTDWCQVSAGGKHSVALRTNGTAWAWGYNSAGTVGDNSTIARSSPVSVVGNVSNWSYISAGCTHSLAIRTKQL